MASDDRHGQPPMLIEDDPSTELSSNRTAMSFERTAMGADRTLMAIVRTSLSLIGFGFTIFEAFRSLSRQFNAVPDNGPRNLGLALVTLGILLLILGLFGNWRTAKSLRARRERLHDLGLLHHGAKVRVSSTIIVAWLLLMVGLFAVTRIVFHVGPI